MILKLFISVDLKTILIRWSGLRLDTQRYNDDGDTFFINKHQLPSYSHLSSAQKDFLACLLTAEKMRNSGQCLCLVIEILIFNFIIFFLIIFFYILYIVTYVMLWTAWSYKFPMSRLLVPSWWHTATVAVVFEQHLILDFFAVIADCYYISVAGNPELNSDWVKCFKVFSVCCEM